MAQTMAQAEKAFDRLVRDFGAKYPKAVDCLMPAEHRIHLRTTKAIELCHHCWARSVAASRFA
jgi:hypothetical protein